MYKTKTIHAGVLLTKLKLLKTELNSLNIKITIIVALVLFHILNILTYNTLETINTDVVK